MLNGVTDRSELSFQGHIRNLTILETPKCAEEWR